ncbi:hypothetical protein Pfo_023311 [Paulownia fortunei]|nr:hypothetical protein Pfo_023311 [Paulownia fortunei]
MTSDSVSLAFSTTTITTEKTTTRHGITIHSTTFPRPIQLIVSNRALRIYSSFPSQRQLTVPINFDIALCFNKGKRSFRSQN